uniref:DNA-protecting protein DprA n=1 Tax=Eiseniibacteriota bacterium TaxID=2212470 RepID=A0A832MMJ5_UNCEI
MASRPRRDGLPAEIPGARIVRRGADGWPAALDDLPDPPPCVWVLGALPAAARAAAVVGSRAATPYGRGVARRLAADLARLGVTVVSGLARGIDAEAHEGALAAGGATVAVLPGGLAPVHPRHHEDLARRVAAHGALLAERPPGSPAFPSRFLERNRLIAALAGATVVVEAAERSGALATAARARALGRPLLAVPGDLDRPTSAGANALLRAGARPCLDASDVLRALEAAPSAASNAAGAGPADAPAARLLARLATGVCGLEALAAAAGLGAGAALAALLELEWAGLVERVPGSRWRRRA